MTTLLREPLLHFLVLGAAIFGLFAALDEGPAPTAADRVEVTEADAARLADQFEATWRRPPTEDELSRLIDAEIRTEVLAREAALLGLDRGDAVIRQRLASKMTFVLESAADTAMPTNEALAAHLASHPDRFARGALVSFEQMPVRPDVPDDAVQAAVRAGTFAEDLAASSLLPHRLPPSPKQVVDATFGAGFFDAVAAEAPGPRPVALKSAFGTHLVRVLSVEPASLPPLEEIREAVERDWRATRRAEILDERLEALLGRYEIARPSPAQEKVAEKGKAE
jgi:hypothetical protein